MKIYWESGHVITIITSIASSWKEIMSDLVLCKFNYDTYKQLLQ